MKLFRWSLAGAGAYAIYKYSIGKKAKGEKVFETPDDAPEAAGEDAGKTRPTPEKPKRRVTPARGKRKDA